MVKSRVKTSAIIVLSVTCAFLVICTLALANMVNEKQSEINNLKAENVSLQEENRDVMNLYSLYSNENSIYENVENSYTTNVALERRIRFLYEQLGYDYDEDYYRGSISYK